MMAITVLFVFLKGVIFGEVQMTICSWNEKIKNRPQKQILAFYKIGRVNALF